MVIPGHRKYWEITGNRDSRLLIGQIFNQSEATEWIVLKIMKRYLALARDGYMIGQNDHLWA